MRQAIKKSSLAALAFGFVALGSCRQIVITLDPGSGTGGAGGGQPSQCSADSTWLPNTSPPVLYEPAPHPAPDCPFYQLAYQTFLQATQLGADGEPALASYATIDDVFTPTVPFAAGALAPPGTHRGTAMRAWLGNVKQPGQRFILVDQDNHAVYTGIHLNQAYVDFIAASHLQTADAIRAAAPNLRLPSGLVALRSAWKDIDPADGVTGDYSSYITTTAWVSRLSQDTASHAIVEDPNHPRPIRVALLSLHVAFTLPGHPEMIWMTFEHADATGQPDLVPVDPRSMNPTPDDPLNLRQTEIASAFDFPLYHARTQLKDGNLPVVESEQTLDASRQLFAWSQSIYRMYPASRSHTAVPARDVVGLNASFGQLVEQKRSSLSQRDQRGRYRLIGGLWMDKPRYFAVSASLQNDDSSPLILVDPVGGGGGAAGGPNLKPSVEREDDVILNGTDSVYSLTAGEDRLSGAATESFTQQPSSYHNCLQCHNTQTMTSDGATCEKGSPFAIKLIEPKLINVSHVFSEFLVRECAGDALMRPAFCSVACDGSRH